MFQWELLVPLLGILIGGLVVLIPIAGITARIALKPMIEALAGYRQAAGGNEAVQLLERRIALLEEQLNGVDRSVRELAEEADFRRRLEGGQPGGAELRRGGPDA